MGVPETFVRAWKPSVPGIREVLHARFADHAYPAHTHDVWTLFVVDEGAIRYDLDRQARGAAPSMVSVLPPHVVHDGRPAGDRGYRKRVLYLETSVLGEDLVGPAVDRPAWVDDALHREVDALHRAVACADATLEAEVRLLSVAERLREHLTAGRHEAGTGSDAADPAGDRAAAEQLRVFLDARLFDRPTIAEAASTLGMPATRVARAFSVAFGIPPHAYVDGRRLEAARDRMLAGQPLADVAAEVGYVDQAHLTRRFKRFLGTTPGRFAGEAGMGVRRTTPRRAAR